MRPLLGLPRAAGRSSGLSLRHLPARWGCARVPALCLGFVRAGSLPMFALSQGADIAGAGHTVCVRLCKRRARLGKTWAAGP